MRTTIRLGIVILLWALTAIIANLLIPQDWHLFSGYVAGIITGIVLMVGE
jgi:hypothetical protein